MKRKQLLESTPCKFPVVEKEEVLAAAQLIQINTEEYLNIDLFYQGKRQGRYFASIQEKDWCVHIDGSWKKMRLDNAARAIMRQRILKGAEYYYYIEKWKFATKADEKIAINYLRTHSVSSFEENISYEKKRKAIRRKEERIEEEMSIVDPVTERMEQWLTEEVFPEEYLFIEDEEKTRKYACTKCGAHSWTKLKFKNYQETICPKCGERVKVEKKSDKKFKYQNVVILQTAPQSKEGKWIERQFRAEAWWTPEGKTIHMHENLRAIIPKGKTWGKLYFGEHPNSDEWQQEWWDKNNRGQRFLNSLLYPYNLDEVMPCGNLEHSGIDILAKQGLKFHVNKAIVQNKSRKYLEYLIKAGMTTMAIEIINQYGWWGDPTELNKNGKKISEVLKIDGNRVSRIKELNGGLNTLEWLQYEETMGIKISKESLQYLASKNVSMSECKDILKELKSVNRMVNYMKKQKVAPKKLVITWRDYLRMAKAEGYDITDDIVRFPKDLKARHDYLVELGNERNDKERLKGYAKLDKQIKERLPEAARYFWENDQYMIIPAGTCEELMKEGRTLHHCVGRDDHYMKKMAEGTSWILFLRKKEKLEKAYYTVEIDMKEDRILQYYSEFDRKPDKAVINKVLEKFKQSIKRSRKQERIRVPVEAIA